MPIGAFHDRLIDLERERARDGDVGVAFIATIDAGPCTTAQSRSVLVANALIADLGELGLICSDYEESSH